MIVVNMYPGKRGGWYCVEGSHLWGPFLNRAEAARWWRQWPSNRIRKHDDRPR